MNRSISSSIAADVFRRVADGQAIEAIAADLDIPVRAVFNLVGNVAPNMLPKRSGRKSPAHKLTLEDKRKGGAASQKTKQAQRKKSFEQLCSLIDLSNTSSRTAAIAYSLLPGSPKEFLVTIPSEEAGLVLLKALKNIGAPDNSIHFQWRSALDSPIEEHLVRSSWGELGECIEFAASGNIKSLRLRVSNFLKADNNGDLKVSSRGLAQAFLAKGREALIEAAK